MSMLPKISTEFVGSTADYNIETMGDTTHVMVNGFCYHVAQIQTPDLKAVCEILLQASKSMAQAVEEEPRRGIRNMDGTIEYFTGEY